FRSRTFGDLIAFGTQLGCHRICIGFIRSQCHLHHPLLVLFSFQKFTCLFSFCFLLGFFSFTLFVGFTFFLGGFTFSFFLFSRFTLFLGFTFCFSRLTFCFGFLLLL